MTIRDQYVGQEMQALITPPIVGPNAVIIIVFKLTKKRYRYY